MSQTQNSQPTHKPDNKAVTGLSLTRSIVTINSLIAMVFLAGWLWLSWQMDFLLNQRTDELGHQLAEVTAFAGAEAVIAEDDVYLTTLIKRINQKQFVEQVALYRVDGTLLVKTETLPTNNNAQMDNNELNETNAVSPGNDSQNSQGVQSSPKQSIWDDWLVAYLPSYHTENTVYMATINWEGNDVGWVQVTLNRGLIESDIRKASYTLSLFTLAAFMIISLLSTFILWHRHNKIKALIKKSSQKFEKTNTETSGAMPSDLHQVARQLKNNGMSQNDFRFKNVTATQHNNLPEKLEYRGYLVVVRIRQSNQNQSNSQMITHTDTALRILSNVAAYFSLNFYCTDRDQALFTSDDSQPDDIIKLVFLLLNLNKALDKQKQPGLSFNAVVDKTEVTLMQINSNIIKANNAQFNTLLSQFRRLKHAIWIGESATHNMVLVDQNNNFFSNNIVIDNNADKTIAIEDDTLSLLERFANSLVNKYFPNREV